MTRTEIWYQSNDLGEELADAQRRWASLQGTWPTCPDCGSDEVYGNGPDAKELGCPNCGLQYDPRDYCPDCGHPLDSQGDCWRCDDA